MARKFYAEHCPYGAGYNLRNQLYIFRDEDVCNGWVLRDPDTRRRVTNEYASDFYHAEARQIPEGKHWETAKLLPAVEVSISGRCEARYPFTPAIYDDTTPRLWHVAIQLGQMSADAITHGTERDVAVFVKHSLPVGASFGWHAITTDIWVERFGGMPVQYPTNYEVEGE